MNTFEDIYRAMQDIEDAIDNDDNLLSNLNEREKMFAGRVALIAKRLGMKLDNNT